jgi:hypothetical protein
MESKVKGFLSLYGIKVKKRESLAYVELMMDNHKCIDYNGIEYYIPNGCMFWSYEDSEIFSYLIENYRL